MSTTAQTRLRKAALLPAVLSLLASLMSGSCNMVNDLLNMTPLEVVSYNPAERYASADSLSDITIRFSSAMNRSSAEAAFTLDDGSGALSGRFSWQRNATKMVFHPQHGFAAATQYTVSVSSDAEDRWGNNLKPELLFAFSTGTDSVPPWVAGHTPADGQQTALETIVIEFSKPMRYDCVYRSFMISPSVALRADWDLESRVVTYTPLQPLSSATRYTVTVGNEACDRSGNRLVEEHQFTFVTEGSSDLNAEVVRITRSGAILEPDPQRFINRVGMEKDDEIEVLFGGPVALSARSNAVVLSPSVPHWLRWSPLFDSATLVLREPLVWGEIYQLVAAQTTFRFVVDGVWSQPLQLEAIALSNSVSSGASGFVELSLGDSVTLFTPQSGSEPGSIANSNIAVDFVLTHAANAVVSLGGLMSAFRISSGSGAFAFTVLDMALDPSDSPFQPSAQRSVVRALIDARNVGGAPMEVVTIELGEQAHDNYGNRLLERYRIEVNAQ
ncbi:MAG: hypothetical protein EA404_12270 [Spirochaetaceae bacterium]|nr:MAG: hypothetical protein EA404_12270 [Spirochaetaceae bacterium]